MRNGLGGVILFARNVSSPEQVAALAKVADGAIVGSALVRLITEHGDAGQVLELAQLLEAEVDIALRDHAAAGFEEELALGVGAGAGDGDVLVGLADTVDFVVQRDGACAAELAVEAGAHDDAGAE